MDVNSRSGSQYSREGRGSLCVVMQEVHHPMTCNAVHKGGLCIVQLVDTHRDFIVAMRRGVLSVHVGV